MLVDSHCHLDFAEFDAERDAIVARARQVGVYRMVTIGTTMREWPRVRAIAETYDDVFCSVGIHPHEAAEETITAEELARYADDPKVVGIGESGLDYFYDHAPREAQQLNFRQHIRAAMMTGLPLIVHTRNAEDDTIRLLEEEKASDLGPLRGVIHCYSSARALGEAALGMGFYISYSGILTFKKSDEIRDIAKDIPLDRLLVETDAPYLAPMPHRGKTCEPAFVADTARHLAAVKNVSEDEIAAYTTENFYRLFSKVSR